MGEFENDDIRGKMRDALSKRAAELHSADEGGLSRESGISLHGFVTPSAERISAARFLAGVLNAISPTFNQPPEAFEKFEDLTKRTLSRTLWHDFASRYSSPLQALPTS